MSIKKRKNRLRGMRNKANHGVRPGLHYKRKFGHKRTR
jgi:hypothetical protein